ncbi:MAG: hypothetical protein KGL39_21830 [Patescibacteria group bacterium]|nr:hypothetical protein [Patescibacteria group bacterium]
MSAQNPPFNSENPAEFASDPDFDPANTDFDPISFPETEPPLDSDPATFTAWPGTLLASFLDRCALDPITGCWNWLGKMSHGRNPIWVFYGKSSSALALAWELFVGPPPRHGVIRRSCSNPLCVRPDHLTLQTGLRVKGRRAGIAKLTPEAILYIRSSALSKLALARKFGVTKWTIWAVKTGRRGGLTTIGPSRVFQNETSTGRTAEIQRISQKLKRAARHPLGTLSAPANSSPVPGYGTTPPEVVPDSSSNPEQPRQK